MKIEIIGMTFFRNDDGRNPYTTLALAEVYLVDLAMTLRGVRLTWSEKNGARAMAPSPRKETPAIEWYHKGPLATQLAKMLLDMFQRMGGELPSILDAKSEAVAAAKAGGIERRVFPATFSVHDDEANDNEAVEGLHRTLGLEHEEAFRACA